MLICCCLRAAIFIAEAAPVPGTAAKPSPISKLDPELKFEPESEPEFTDWFELTGSSLPAAARFLVPYLRYVSDDGGGGDEDEDDDDAAA